MAAIQKKLPHTRNLQTVSLNLAHSLDRFKITLLYNRQGDFAEATTALLPQDDLGRFAVGLKHGI